MWPVPVMRSMLSSRDSLRMTPTSADARIGARAKKNVARKMASRDARMVGASEEKPWVKRRCLETGIGKQPPLGDSASSPIYIEPGGDRRVAWKFVKCLGEKNLQRRNRIPTTR